jgi:hypothetical protein
MEQTKTRKRAYIPRNRAKRVKEYPPFVFTPEEKLLLSFLLTDIRNNDQVCIVTLTFELRLPYQFDLNSVVIEGEFSGKINVPVLVNYSEVRFRKWRDPKDTTPLPKVPRTRKYPTFSFHVEEKMLLSFLLTDVKNNDKVCLDQHLNLSVTYHTSLIFPLLSSRESLPN